MGEKITPPTSLTLWWCGLCNHEVKNHTPGKKHYAWGRVCRGVPHAVIYVRQNFNPADFRMKMEV